jgi:hypothetical protein
VTGINHGTLRADRARGHACAAFGVAEPLLPDRCLLLDGLAWLIRDDLTDAAMNRRAAATMVMAFWPEWMTAAARLEHRREAVVFAAAEQEGNIWWCGSGLANQLRDFVSTGPLLRRLFVVNVAQLMADMERRAMEAGLDLSAGSFTLPPDDPVFVAWVAEFKSWRDAQQRKFDPLHAKPPPSPSARRRREIEALTCDLQQ